MVLRRRATSLAQVTLKRLAIWAALTQLRAALGKALISTKTNSF
jgi:hypothetical protein